MDKNCQNFGRSFSIEIRTISSIISLKHADFLALMVNAVLGSVRFKEKIGDCPYYFLGSVRFKEKIGDCPYYSQGKNR